MQKLIQGIRQFQGNCFLPLQGLFEQLANGQNPETLFITCSDSRIDLGLLTQARPGDLFILRNAGNIVPPHGSASSGEAATIEFAVAVLGVKDIVICGHSHCGAMQSLLKPETVASLPALCSWLSHAEMTRRIMRDNYSHLDGERLLAAAVEENVLVQLENLRTIPAVGSRLVRGDLHLHGWIYKIETGEVVAYDVENAQFVALAEYDPRQKTICNDRPPVATDNLFRRHSHIRINPYDKSDQRYPHDRNSHLRRKDETPQPSR